LTSDGKTEFVSREEDKKKGIPEQHMDKIVTVNISKKLSGSLYDKIKTLLIDPNIINRRIYVKVGDKTNISVTEEDIKEYLNVIG
jgi:ribosomal protein S17